MVTHHRLTLFTIVVVYIPLVHTLLSSESKEGSNRILTHHYCIHDNLRNLPISGTFIDYNKSHDRTKREVREWYQPIRTYTSLNKDENLVTTDHVDRLEAVIDQASSIIHRIVRVFPVPSPLLLSRSPASCRFTHGDGPNAGKCSATIGDTSETCLDNFAIPDDHLEGLWEWDESSPEPVNTIHRRGSGVEDSDMILYVKAQDTPTCDSQQSIIAYARHCKVDQNGRPIAGGINFCPNHLEDDQFDMDRFVLVALHEILHILGFSRSLFEKFKSCSVLDGTLMCEDLDSSLVDDSDHMLKTPAVVAASQAHFNCTQGNFGGPLENKDGEGISSHWESRMMHGSLMAPAIKKNNKIFLDNLTLALLEDTGWYKVNYEYADSLPWGQGQGCTFGHPDICASQSEFFCAGNSSGCDYTHLNQAVCTTDDFLEGCSIYSPHPQGNCEAADAQHDEITLISRCLISNITLEMPLNSSDSLGQCLNVRCQPGMDEYMVQINQSQWINCPASRAVSVPGSEGAIHCPAVDIICVTQSKLERLVASEFSPLDSTTTSTTQIMNFLQVAIYFNDMPYSAINESIPDAKQAFIASLVNSAILQRDQIHHLEITTESVFEFSVSSPEATGLSEIQRNLTEVVQLSQFGLHIQEQVYYASSIRSNQDKTDISIKGNEKLVFYRTFPDSLAMPSVSATEQTTPSGATVMKTDFILHINLIIAVSIAALVVLFICGILSILYVGVFKAQVRVSVSPAPSLPMTSSITHSFSDRNHFLNSRHIYEVPA